MLSKKIEEYKNGLFFSKRQKEILIGLLLGDGHLEKPYNSMTGRLKVEHSYKQKDYTDWLYKEFKNWVRSKPKIRELVVWGKARKNYRFCTYSHKILGALSGRFYGGERKNIPKDLEKKNKPFGLEGLYMDDGSIKSKRHRGVFLNTQGFKENDIKKLQKILKNKFGVDSKTRTEKNGKQIYLGGKSGERFIGIINPYIISSMKYKIPRVLRLTELPKL